MLISFDIETIPNSGMLNRLPPVEAKTGNLKDPEKIAEKERQAKLEQVEKMALSPLYGRVCAWCAESITGDKFNACIEEDSDEEEIRVIAAAFKRIRGSKILTYNGNNFDLPFLYKRAVILGVDPRGYALPPLSEVTAKYKNIHHIDLMNVWCGFGNYEKLDNLASALLGEHKNEIDFHDFPEMIKTDAGRKELLAYCQQDVSLLLKLYTRVKGIL